MKHRIKIGIYLAFITLLFSHCIDKEPASTSGSIQLQFKLTYDGQPIQLFTDKVHYLEDTISYTQFALYLSRAALLTADGETALFDNSLLHFSNNSEQQIITIEDVSSGIYDGLRLGIGVDSMHNASTPVDYPPESVLNDASMYWPGWTSYIFSKTEGKVYLGDSLSSFAYHTGSDEAYRTKIFNKSIKVITGQQTVLHFTIDLKEIFKKGSSYYDLVQKPTIHNERDRSDVLRVSDNIKRAIVLQD